MDFMIYIFFNHPYYYTNLLQMFFLEIKFLNYSTLFMLFNYKFIYYLTYFILI